MSKQELAVEPVVPAENAGCVHQKKAIEAPAGVERSLSIMRNRLRFRAGMRLDINGVTILLISGTASIDENGDSVHDRRFPRANLAHLLEHHRPAGCGRRHLERRGAHHLLPARHRARLRRVQRTPHAILQGTGFGPFAGFHGHSSHSLPAGSADRDGSNGHLPHESQGAKPHRLSGFAVVVVRSWFFAVPGRTRKGRIP